MKQISFKDYLMTTSLNEGLDLATLPLGEINVKKIEEGSRNIYQSYFKIQDKKFLVELELESGNKNNYQGVYDINFQGPNGVLLTNDSSPGEARKIYNYLLASIYKITQTIESDGQKVNGFSFIYAQINMDLIYESFYKSYLLPLGFIKANKKSDYTLYLKKEYLREFIKEKNPDEKWEILKSVKDAENQSKESISNNRQEKGRLKQLRILTNNSLDTIIYFKKADGKIKNGIGYIIKTNPEWLYVTILHINPITSEVERSTVVSHDANFNQPVTDKNKIYELLSKIKNSKWLHQIDTLKLNNSLKSFFSPLH